MVNKDERAAEKGKLVVLEVKYELSVEFRKKWLTLGEFVTDELEIMQPQSSVKVN